MARVCPPALGASLSPGSEKPRSERQEDFFIASLLQDKPHSEIYLDRKQSGKSAWNISNQSSNVWWRWATPWASSTGEETSWFTPAGSLALHPGKLMLFLSALFAATFTTEILPHAELRAGCMSPAWSRCLSNLLPHVFKHFTCRRMIKARRLNMDVQSLINIHTCKLGVFYL